MTAIFYPDLVETSPGGRFRLEVKSPDNGAITHRDGTPASASGFSALYGSHQNDFRYQFIDTVRDEVLWERWQRKGEESPHELVVSDDGFSVIRIHGFAPKLVVVSKVGDDLLGVNIGSKRFATSAPRAPDASTTLWTTDELQHTTAGYYWTHNSWRYFFTYHGTRYFVWRTALGGRLVVDLDHSRLLSDSDVHEDGLLSAAKRTESVSAEETLTQLTSKLPIIRDMLQSENDSDDRRDLLRRELRFLKPAMALAAAHRLRQCESSLRQWEPLDVRSYRTGSTALGKRGWLEAQQFRPLIAHALRLFGSAPAGYPCYYFDRGQDARIEMPERLGDREARTLRLHDGMNAAAVLQLLGAPDFISNRSVKGAKRYFRPELWEYDFNNDDGWTTLKLQWTEDEKSVWIKSIERRASTWMNSLDREPAILHF